jgi:hypothetical protein
VRNIGRIFSVWAFLVRGVLSYDMLRNSSLEGALGGGRKGTLRSLDSITRLDGGGEVAGDDSHGSMPLLRR